MKWVEGKVSLQDSVSMPRRVTGKGLRDSFSTDIEALTLGLIRIRGNALRLGPLELIRFGQPRIARTSVQWPIEGGLLARSAGGRLRIELLYGRLVESLEGYKPMLPRTIYVVTQVPVHHLLTRLHLLRVRGRRPEPGPPADRSRRMAAAAIDAAYCLSIAALIGRRRRRLPVLFGFAAGYHLACWTLTGVTLGGAVMKQRVVSVDGSNLTVGQALVRLALLPLGAVRMRDLHDEIAGTEVISN
ncbi:MAG TPA: RDD family protein [Candidatus Micrarchaeaceae archaeon]|nr:RDD family protein [Candidatus Micrarchaeaceae archaeon]